MKCMNGTSINQSNKSTATVLCNFPPDPETMSFDDLPVHVLTSLVKAFFRELSEPLITSELYENFVNISGQLSMRTRS